ncbi:MAG: SpoIIE family protein phosphatase [Clostridiaceae bacterium]|nr:SpoIIE family protein phosphatase [Clostridiaceae bacterium]
MYFKLGIRSKMLILVLGISLVSLLACAFISYDALKKLGDYALDCSRDLGNSAADDSQSALESQTGRYLLKVAVDQAEISNSILLRVEDKVEAMARYAEVLWDNPSGFVKSPPLSPMEAGKRIRLPVYELAADTDKSNVDSELGLLGNMKYVFEPILDGESSLSSIYLGTQSGITIMFSNNPPAENKGYDPRKRPWYLQASEERGVIWTDTYKDAFGNGLMVTCSMACFDKDGNLRGVLGADVTLKALNEQVINTQIGNLGYALLVDEKGKVIFRPGLDVKDEKWDESFKTDDLTQTDNEDLKKIVNNMTERKTGVEVCSFDNGKKYIAYAPVTSTNWSLAVVMPLEEIVKPIVETRDRITSATKSTENYISVFISDVIVRFGIIFAILLIIMVIAATGLSGRIINPRLALGEGVRIVGDGNLEYNLSLRTGDEIEDLAKAFNKMTLDLKTYIKNLNETTAEKERIESELKIAHSIQNSMLPRIFPPFPERKEIDIFASMEPAKEVGGDFYDFFFIDENKLCFVMADVSGKGVPAALFMVIAKTLIKNQALLKMPAEEILTSVNVMLYADNDECMFVTAFLAILEVDTGRLTFSNAGHNPPLLKRHDGEYEWVAAKKGFVLAGMENTKFQANELTIGKGDMLFLYTDGVTEAMDIEGKLFSDQRLKDTLNKLKNLEGKELTAGIRNEIREHVKDAPQSDDITMMVLKYNGPY